VEGTEVIFAYELGVYVESVKEEVWIVKSTAATATYTL
jgi:hypothetical protein